MAGFRTSYTKCTEERIVNTSTDYTQAEGPLITRARRGNSEAFSELVRMHSRRIYSISLRILKNHADAEDNLQDVLCKMYRNRFQRRSRFSTWLVSITINEARMKIRKENSARAAGHTDLPMEAGENKFVLEIRDGYPDPERQYITSDLARKAFRGLHPLLRQTFILHKGHGWTHREVAGTLGIPIATVKSRVFRARARMRQQLQPVCGM
jgi:RNA polymerase sigma-70 factor (ECF subfamily)